MRPLSALLSFGLLAGVGPAGAQTFNYVFSSCASGATMQVNFPVTPPVVITPDRNAYGYIATSATFTLTINGGSQTYTGPAGANIQYFPSTGPDVTAATEMLIAPEPGTGVPVWSVNLYGAGSLLPNGLNATLPPISMWTLPVGGMHDDYINVGGRGGQFYYLDTIGPCGGSSSGGSNGGGSDAGASMGDPSDLPGSCDCGLPINIGNGNMYDHATDYQTAGLNRLEFVRYYNSMAPSNTFAATLGTNWRSSYDRYLRLVSSSSAIAERPDGQEAPFTLTSGAWTTDTDLDYKLTNSGATWTLTDNQDTVETYSASGANEAVLQSIRLRNGYTQSLQYSGGLLSTVSDSYQLELSFSYSGGKLQTVTTPDGMVLTYGYTGSQLTSVVYTPGASLTYLYENPSFPGALTGIIDEDGNRYASWTYDSMGRATSSQHAGGADLVKVAYNDNDGSRTVTNPLGEQETYKFTTLQGVPKIAEIDRLAVAGLPAAVQKYTYDSNGYLASQTNWNGVMTSYVNDSHGQPTTMNEAAGTTAARTTTIAYHAMLHLPVKIVTPGLTTSYAYDSNGQLLTKTLTDTTTATTPYPIGGQARTWTYTWANFLPASSQTPRSDVKGLTTFTYDSSGALTATTNALGQTVQITQHLPGGLPQMIVDANGVSTNLTYDARLRLLTSTVSTAAGALTTSYTYDAAGNRLSVTLPDGSTINDSYDAAHRLTGMSDLYNQSVAYTLDAMGDRTQTNTADASGSAVSAHSGKFDALGRLQQDIGGAGQTTTYAYDSNGNPLSVTDPLSHAIHHAFDALNRLIDVTDPAGSVTRTTYDALSRPSSVTDPNGGVTTYVYDGFGDVIECVSPDSGATIYRYDPDGNRTQRVDGAGAIANYAYDALDRAIGASYPGDAAENVVYTYDQGSLGIGRLTGISDAAGTLSRSYDERGNMLSETRVNGAATLATGYSYDAANRVASITYPSGWMVVYTRDIMGRTTALTAQPPGGGAAIPVAGSAGYQPFGPINALTFGNGVVETRTFDLDYRVTKLADAGTGALQNLAYAYDAANNVASVMDGVTAPNSQSFKYDTLNRLTSASGGYGSFGYTYDNVDNRLTKSAGGSSMAYAYTAKSNQLASVTAGGMQQAIGYSKTGAVNNYNPGAGAAASLAYNQAGRLATVMSGSNPAAQYTYDGFGQRLSRVGAVTGDTLYQYDASGHLLEETDRQGNPLVDYVYIDALPVAAISPGESQVYFLHNDRLGTPQVATDGNQNVVWSASYGPFGEMSAVPGGIVQDLRMPGQEFDVETGLYHNGFRDYAPAWGRYLQSDPVGLTGGLNTYGYALGNPARWVDPTGMCTGSASQALINTARIGSGLVNIQGGLQQLAAGGTLDTIPIVGWGVAIPFEAIGLARVLYGGYSVYAGVTGDINAAEGTPPPSYNPPVPTDLGQIHQFSPEWLQQNPWYQPVINVTPAVGPVIH